MKDGMVGPYQVGELIGKGGMGEVYRARDTRLDRDVALKILPRELAADPERLARFEREAKVLASLQHQNIAAIYGLENVDDTPVLVLELAEGEDLSKRMEAGALPVEDVRKVARQLALGLEYAHEQGIIHRDLKPANVKLAEAGQIKILDFGLARAFVADGGNSSAGSSWQPTLTQGLTLAGSVLGTAAYMSPEQARGHDVDRRSDIWAFGVILYEMLTGQRLFQGETATDTLAAVMRKDPEWEALPQDDPLLAQICRRCLERDPQLRLRDIGEARIALEGADSTVLGMSAPGLAGLPAGSRSTAKPVLPWALAGILAVGLAAVAFLGLTGRIGPQPEPPRLLHTSVRLDEGMRLDLNPASPGPVQVSPDGKRLAFAAVDTLGQISLHVRELSSPTIRSLPGTNGSAYPFWSADSRSLAFFTDEGLLRRLDISGGPVLTICAAENGKGGDWNQFGEVLLAPSHVASIQLVEATGGETRAVTDLAADSDSRSHRFPHWLPDGIHFLYLAVQRSAGGENDCIVRLGSKDGSVDRALMPSHASAYFSQGHVLFVHDEALMARPFDLEALDFTGSAFPVCENVLAIRAAHCSIFSAVDSDVLAFTTGQGGAVGVSVLERLSPDGESRGVLGDPLMTLGISLGPEGKYVALSMPDMQVGTFDIWLYEIERDLSTRLTFDNETESVPVFSPDGQWIYYSLDRAGPATIYRHRATGAGRPEQITSGEFDCYANSISSDGRWLAYSYSDSAGDFSIGMCDLEGDFAHREVRATPMIEFRPQFSPDGKWLAYVSNETGTIEVFVESVEPGGGRYRVSSQGGLLVRWAPDGGRLYYLTQTNTILAVEVTQEGGALRFGRTVQVAEGVEVTDTPTFDVDAKTGELLVQKPAQVRQFNSLELITGWSALLERGKD